MKPLSDEQRELILEYYFACTDEERFQAAQRLIETDPQAALLFGRLDASMKIMESLRQSEPCPDQLARQTLDLLKAAAVRQSQLRLTTLLNDEQIKTDPYAGRTVWGRILEMAAVAAVVMLLAAGAYMPLRHSRDLAWQTTCQSQLGSIAQAVSHYQLSHGGSLPHLALNDGQAWWKLGNQGDEYESNTRGMWLLVKGDYVDPKVFVCPSSTSALRRLTENQIATLHDFPSREYITYSLRIVRRGTSELRGRTILMADVNPIFEKLPDNYSNGFMQVLNKRLLNANTSNHHGRGQNILLTDGSVEFIKCRTWGNIGDDIFTLSDKDKYYGNELPSRDTDIFLAP